MNEIMYTYNRYISLRYNNTELATGYGSIIRRHSPDGSTGLL